MRDGGRSFDVPGFVREKAFREDFWTMLFGILVTRLASWRNSLDRQGG